MNISIFGLGYVGCVTAACLSSKGHRVTGVDVDESKVELINEGQPTVVEKDIDDLVAAAVEEGRLSATTCAREAVQDSDVSIICVGTPSDANGCLDDTYVRRVTEQIGGALADKESDHTVILRSTVLPGTTEEVVRPALERESGKQVGSEIGLAFNPEFLREGSAVHDFFHPPKTVIGAAEEATADQVASLYADLDAPLHRTSIGVAELVKYADNAFHAMKVAFANEIGSIAKHLGIDGQEVMDIFVTDTKLNISPAYLKPGYAFGGSCLPKDVRALTYFALQNDLDVPLLDAVLPSNEAHWERGLDMILQNGISRVGVLGFSFKAGTDDLRESPVLTLIERMIGKGYSVRIFDRNVNLARLTGTNREYLETRIPHIARLLVDDCEEVVEFGEVLVVGNRAPEFREALAPVVGKKKIIDLVRIFEDPPVERSDYHGIAW